MEYKGKLYGKIGNKYFDTSKTSDDYDNLDQQNKQLLEDIEQLKNKVSNWMDKYTEVNEENKKLQSELKAADSVNKQKYKDNLLNTFGNYCAINGIKLTDSNKVGQAVIDFFKSDYYYRSI